MRTLKDLRNEGHAICDRVAEENTPRLVEEMKAYATLRFVPMTQPVQSLAQVSPPAPANDNGFKPPRVVSPTEWQGQPIPLREWLLSNLVPMQQVTILAGDGGVGKSLLGLQWSAAVATGHDTIGGKPREGSVVYLGAEDEEDEFKRRLADIMAAKGGSFADLTRFHLIPMADMDALLSVPDRAGKMQPTPLWRWFESQVPTWNPTLIVLDTLADLFGGDEIKRAQVRQFVGMLRKVAIAHKCAIILLAHPSQEGMRSGTGSSGSTGWRNSARSQLYLTRPEGKDADDEARELKTMKANYGKVGGSVRIRWQAGAFVPDDGTTVSPAANLMAKKADEVFVELLSKFNKMGLSCSPSPSATYGPSMMEKDSGSHGIKKKAFTDAMRRLLEKGDIKIVEEGPASRTRKRLLVATEMFGNEVAA